MIKRFSVAIIVLATSFKYTSAQYISPAQLNKAFSLWQKSLSDDLDAYIHSLSPEWKLDPSSIKFQEDDTEESWIYSQQQPTRFGMLLIAKIKHEGVFKDKITYFTFDLNYYNPYLEAIKEQEFELINFTKGDDGKLTQVYKHNGAFIITTVDPPNTKGKVLYTVAIQRDNLN